MDLIDEQNKVDEITRRILSGQEVSEAEFRHIVMFNLTAMTQILWELTDQKNGRSESGGKADVTNQGPIMIGPTRPRSIGRKLLPLVASLGTFIAGLAVGYLIP